MRERTFGMAAVAALVLMVMVPADALAGGSAARSGALGVGLGQGTRVWGLSIKTVRGGTGIEVVGGRMGDGYGLNISSLFEIPPLASGDILEFGVNLGAGGALGVGGGGVYASAGIVAGLEFNLVPIPLDIVVDFRPTLDILQDFNVSLISFGGHIRFYF